MKRKNRESCCVADQFCDAPANVTPMVPARARCFHCGEAVCTKCSSKRLFGKYGRVRLCNNCQVEIDGNDEVVMRRLHRMAGGPYVKRSGT